jgi:hypothetical protein
MKECHPGSKKRKGKKKKQNSEFSSCPGEGWDTRSLGLEGLSEEQVSLSPEDRAICRQAKWRSAHGGLA